MTTNQPADRDVEAVAAVLLSEGAAPGSSLHSWRCEYPDRYGECDCVTETAREVVAALLPLIREREAAVWERALREAADLGPLHFAATHTGRDTRGWNVVEVSWLRDRAAANPYTGSEGK